ncbi:MAG: GNAT family N-acetyltransferase [Bacteroidetes bacterium]|nr:MAG: GNAT family N-acetyltransferase [Bacteroidota bacterium]
MIKIVTYTADKLVALVEDKTYHDMPVIPISKQRASSIAHSPRTKPDNVIMACAYQENELVGYLGILPDTLEIKGNIYDAGWLSSMWVSATHRGKGIAPQLINSLLKAWDNMVLTTNQSPAAATVFNKHPEFNALTNNGTRYYVKSRLSYFMPTRNPVYVYFIPVLRVIDSAINTVVNIHRTITAINCDVEMQITQQITPELAHFIQKYPAKSYCKRGVKEFKWMMEFPWVYQSEQPDILASNYEFTISTPDYCNEFVLCYHHKELVGMALVMLKKGELKISYVWCDDTNEPLLADALQKYIRTKTVFEVTVFNSKHQGLMQQGIFYLLRRKLSRPIYVCKKLHEVLKQDNPIFADGDGDSCFA